MDNTWFKLYRGLLEWEWYNDIVTKSLFIHCLLKANYKDKEWQGIKIEQGSFITSSLKLAEELGITRQKIRRGLDNLISTNEITTKTTNKYTLIKVVNWAKYQLDNFNNNQQDNTQVNHQTTIKQPTNNQQTTTTKESNNIYKERKKEKDIIESKDSLSVFTDFEVEKTQKNERIDFESITNYWNSNSKLASITKITDLRKVNVMARIKEFGLESVYKMIDNVSRSPFLKGENNRQWVATFDWCFKPKNFVKVVEGNYLENGKNGNGETDIERRVRLVNERLGEFE